MAEFMHFQSRPDHSGRSGRQSDFESYPEHDLPHIPGMPDHLDPMTQHMMYGEMMEGDWPGQRPGTPVVKRSGLDRSGMRDMSAFYLDPTVSSPNAAKSEQKQSDSSQGSQALQRKEAGTGSAGGPVSEDLQKRIEDVRKGGGHQLPESERVFFEERIGRDFGDVRLHTDSAAAQVSRDVNAKAFTIGNDIIFGDGEYKPGTPEGRRLMAHELTHTVQQGAAGILKRCHEFFQRVLQRSPDKSDPDTFTRIILKDGRVFERVKILRHDRNAVSFTQTSDPRESIQQVDVSAIRKIQYNAFSPLNDSDRNQLNNEQTAGMKGSQQCGPTVMTGIAIDFGLASAGPPVFAESFQYEEYLINAVKANADLNYEQFLNIFGANPRGEGYRGAFQARSNTKDGRSLLAAMHLLNGRFLAPLDPDNFYKYANGSPAYLEKWKLGRLTREEYFKNHIAPYLPGSRVMLFAQTTTSGHFVKLVDVQPDGIIVNDPYGLYNSGYEINKPQGEESIRQFYTWAQAEALRIGDSATFIVAGKGRSQQCVNHH
jgi:hypothetical protein